MSSNNNKNKKSSSPTPYTRDRRLSTLLSAIDTLADINTHAADQYRPVPHEHSLTSFLERKASLTDVHVHDCHSPLEQDSTEVDKDWFADTEDDDDPPRGLASAQGQDRRVVSTMMKSNCDGENEKLRRHRRRGTVDDGTDVLRRERDLHSPSTSPIIPTFFGDSPILTSPPLLRAPGSTESADAFEEAAIEAKPKE